MLPPSDFNLFVIFECPMPRKGNPGEYGLVHLPNAVRTKNVSVQKCSNTFSEIQTMKRRLHMSAQLVLTPRQLQCYKTPPCLATIACSPRFIARTETNLANRGERPRSAERCSDAARSSCECQCVRPAVRVQRCRRPIRPFPSIPDNTNLKCRI